MSLAGLACLLAESGRRRALEGLSDTELRERIEKLQQPLGVVEESQSVAMLRKANP
jgi:hypothetical protein